MFPADQHGPPHGGGTTRSQQPDLSSEAVQRLADEILVKLAGPQGGVGTFVDHAVLALLPVLNRLAGRPTGDRIRGSADPSVEDLRPALQLLQVLLSRHDRPRHDEYDDRRECRTTRGLHGHRDIGRVEFTLSQGLRDCMQWKGLPLFKTVYDFSLYPMILWNLKPRTILEIGSGAGASAVWLADLLSAFGIEGRVYSIDWKVPTARHECVSFVQGDCRTIERALPDHTLQSAAHPWLIIEDAHVNVRGILNHYHPYLAAGDYVVIEDSTGKRGEIGRFLEDHPGAYKVDTYYTDFFGRNATCACDSILVRTSTVSGDRA